MKYYSIDEIICVLNKLSPEVLNQLDVMDHEVTIQELFDWYEGYINNESN